MIKKISKFSFVAIIILLAGVFILYQYSKTSNPWNTQTIGDIKTPVGYECLEAEPGSFVAYMGNLYPLSNPWFFFDGNEKSVLLNVFHFGKNQLRHY